MSSEAEIEAVCETCATKMTFAEALRGSVQVCDKCGDFVDVGEVEWDESDYLDEEELAADGDEAGYDGSGQVDSES